MMVEFGVSLLFFLSGIGLVLLLGWRVKRRFLPVAITTADAPTAGEVAGYLAEVAVRLDERPQRMRLAFDAPRGVWLDLAVDGRLVVRVEGERTRKLDLRGRWIADHPVPLALHGLKLYVVPTSANRFRVGRRPAACSPVALAVATAFFMAAAVYLVTPVPVGAALGLWTGWALDRFGQ